MGQCSVRPWWRQSHLSTPIISLNCPLHSFKIMWSRSTTSNNCLLKFIDVTVIFRVPKHLPRGFLGARQMLSYLWIALPLSPHTRLQPYHLLWRKKFEKHPPKTLYLSATAFISSSKMSYCRRQPLNRLFLIFNINASGDFLFRSWLMSTPLSLPMSFSVGPS